MYGVKKYININNKFKGGTRICNKIKQNGGMWHFFLFVSALLLCRLLFFFCIKDPGNYCIGNCRRPVFSLGVSQHA